LPLLSIARLFSIVAMAIGSRPFETDQLLLFGCRRRRRSSGVDSGAANEGVGDDEFHISVTAMTRDSAKAVKRMLPCVEKGMRKSVMAEEGVLLGKVCNDTTQRARCQG
jgi:hypothetical protein